MGLFYNAFMGYVIEGFSSFGIVFTQVFFVAFTVPLSHIQGKTLSNNG